MIEKSLEDANWILKKVAVLLNHLTPAPLYVEENKTYRFAVSAKASRCGSGR